jgi:acetolactate synthase-1/2/3 large subunit
LPPLAGVARSFGIDAVSGDCLADLEGFFNNLDFSGPRLLDFRLASDEALSPKVSALPQKDGSILSMPLEDMSPLLDLEALEREMLVPLSLQSLAARGTD